MPTIPAAFAVRSLAKCAVAWFVPLLFFACGANDPDKNPSEVLAHFLEAMDRTAHDDGALKDAYALLDETSQHELAARAGRTSSLAGRSYAPWDMIAQGRFRMRFAPAEHAEMRAAISGNNALVHVRSTTGREADVPLVREHGHWRIKLELATIAASSARTP
jgi:hypothetical protein